MGSLSHQQILLAPLGSRPISSSSLTKWTSTQLSSFESSFWLYAACLYYIYSASLQFTESSLVPFCLFLHIHFSSTTSTPVLPADKTSAFPLPQFCPAQWVCIPAFCHFHLSPCPIHISFCSPPSSHCYCVWLLALPPSMDKPLCPLPVLSFPRWALQRVLQREWVTELLSLQGSCWELQGLFSFFLL